MYHIIILLISLVSCSLFSMEKKTPPISQAAAIQPQSAKADKKALQKARQNIVLAINTVRIQAKPVESAREAIHEYATLLKKKNTPYEQVISSLNEVIVAQRFLDNGVKPALLALINQTVEAVYNKKPSAQQAAAQAPPAQATPRQAPAQEANEALHGLKAMVSQNSVIASSAAASDPKESISRRDASAGYSHRHLSCELESSGFLAKTNKKQTLTQLTQTALKGYLDQIGTEKQKLDVSKVKTLIANYARALKNTGFQEAIAITCVTSLVKKSQLTAELKEQIDEFNKPVIKEIYQQASANQSEPSAAAAAAPARNRNKNEQVAVLMEQTLLNYLNAINPEQQIDKNKVKKHIENYIRALKTAGSSKGVTIACVGTCINKSTARADLKNKIYEFISPIIDGLYPSVSENQLAAASAAASCNTESNQSDKQDELVEQGITTELSGELSSLANTWFNDRDDEQFINSFENLLIKYFQSIGQMFDDQKYHRFIQIYLIACSQLYTGMTPQSVDMLNQIILTGLKKFRTGPLKEQINKELENAPVPEMQMPGIGSTEQLGSQFGILKTANQQSAQSVSNASAAAAVDNVGSKPDEQTQFNRCVDYFADQLINLLHRKLDKSTFITKFENLLNNYYKITQKKFPHAPALNFVKIYITVYSIVCAEFKNHALEQINEILLKGLKNSQTIINFQQQLQEDLQNGHQIETPNAPHVREHYAALGVPVKKFDITFNINGLLEMLSKSDIDAFQNTLQQMITEIKTHNPSQQAAENQIKSFIAQIQTSSQYKKIYKQSNEAMRNEIDDAIKAAIKKVTEENQQLAAAAAADNTDSKSNEDENFKDCVDMLFNDLSNVLSDWLNNGLNDEQFIAKFEESLAQHYKKIDQKFLQATGLRFAETYLEAIDQIHGEFADSQNDFNQLFVTGLEKSATVMNLKNKIPEDFKNNGLKFRMPPIKENSAALIDLIDHCKALGIPEDYYRLVLHGDSLLELLSKSDINAFQDSLEQLLKKTQIQLRSKEAAAHQISLFVSRLQNSPEYKQIYEPLDEDTQKKIDRASLTAMQKFMGPGQQLPSGTKAETGKLLDKNFAQSDATQAAPLSKAQRANVRRQAEEERQRQAREAKLARQKEAQAKEEESRRQKAVRLQEQAAARTVRAQLDEQARQAIEREKAKQAAKAAQELERQRQEQEAQMAAEARARAEQERREKEEAEARETARKAAVEAGVTNMLELKKNIANNQSKRKAFNIWHAWTRNCRTTDYRNKQLLKIMQQCLTRMRETMQANQVREKTLQDKQESKTKKSIFKQWQDALIKAQADKRPAIVELQQQPRPAVEQGSPNPTEVTPTESARRLLSISGDAPRRPRRKKGHRTQKPDQSQLPYNDQSLPPVAAQQSLTIPVDQQTTALAQALAEKNRLTQQLAHALYDAQTARDGLQNQLANAVYNAQEEQARLQQELAGLAYYAQAERERLQNALAQAAQEAQHFAALAANAQTATKASEQSAAAAAAEPPVEPQSAANAPGNAAYSRPANTVREHQEIIQAFQEHRDRCPEICNSDPIRWAEDHRNKVRAGKKQCDICQKKATKEEVAGALKTLWPGWFYFPTLGDIPLVTAAAAVAYMSSSPKQ